MLEQVWFLVGAVLEEMSCGKAELFQMHFFSHVVVESLVQRYGTINFTMW